MDKNEKDENSLWYRLWDHKSQKEKKRLKSFIPLTLYTCAFMYGVLYLSILNTVNRDQHGTTVKRSWTGDISQEQSEQARKLQREIDKGYKALRKRVSGEG